LSLLACSVNGVSSVVPTNVADGVCNELSISLLAPDERFVNEAKGSDKGKSLGCNHRLGARPHDGYLAEGLRLLM
jgi:hypothetical protein